MNKKHIITISGKPGSGKSSTADKVAELLSYTRYSSGSMVRKIIEKRGLTLEEYNKIAAKDHSIDAEIDEALRALRDKKDIVVDSRLGFYWIPESFKVYLDLDMDVASVRIYKDIDANAQRKGEVGTSMADVTRQVKERMEDERGRFKTMYGVDPYASNNFDLVIDTSQHSPLTVASTVFDYYKRWLNSDTWQPVHSEVPLGYSLKNDY